MLAYCVVGNAESAAVQGWALISGQTKNSLDQSGLGSPLVVLCPGTTCFSAASVNIAGYLPTTIRYGHHKAIRLSPAIRTRGKKLGFVWNRREDKSSWTCAEVLPAADDDSWRGTVRQRPASECVSVRAP